MVSGHRATDNRPAEIGAIRKSWQGRIRVVLAYPNSYYVGMSNLGFQTAYLMFNSIESMVCERAFLSENVGKGRIRTAESGRLLSDADIIAFSVSYENDYPNILEILKKAGIPLLSRDRESVHPLVIAGGVACFLNPEPIAPFIDCFLMGEAEALLPRFFACFDELDIRKRTGFFEKNRFLKHVTQNVPGAYVPEFYRPTYHKDGTICSFEQLHGAPPQVERVFLKDLSHIPTCSTLLTHDTTFRKTFLIEVGRGCPHGCRFCSAGYIYRPPRFRSFSVLEECIRKGASVTDRIGLVGASVSDLPDLAELCRRARGENSNIRISFSSLRADALDPGLVSELKQSRIKTATIAPDAGSERMRNVINKGITRADILNAAEALVSEGIPNLKLYFMIGLPTETSEDIEAIVTLCREIKSVFLQSSRKRKRIGEITVSLSSFVPKPFTPFQRVPMDDVRTLKRKIKQIKDGLKGVANLRVRADIPRHAQIQALFSRGDRRVAEILSLASDNRGNWAKTLKESPLNIDAYLNRERSPDEFLPWNFIAHGVRPAFLEQEYKRAKEGRPSPPCPMESCNICGVCSVDG